MKRYPLEALRELRDQGVDEKQRQLAECIEHTEQARGRVRAACERLREEQRSSACIQEQELCRAHAGVARVEDLQRAADHRLGAEHREAVLEQALRRAEQTLTEAEHACEVAEQELVEAKAQAKVIDRHRDDFVAQQQLEQEKQQEEAALEVWVGEGARRR